MAKFVTITHSKLNLFNTCPRQFAARYVLKTVPFEESEHIKRGNRIHKELEARVQNGVPLPPDLSHLEAFAATPDFARASGHKIYTESNLAVDRQFNFVEHGNWDAKYILGKDDLTMISPDGTRARSLDWKTGKIRVEEQQLRIQALLVFAKHTSVQEFSGSYVFVDHDIISPPVRIARGRALTQDMQDNIGEYEEALKNDTFPPNKSGLCKEYCPVHSCPFNGKHTI